MQKHTLNSQEKPSSFTLDPPEAVETALRAAVNQKSLDVRSLDLRGVSTIADYFVIASGTSERHVKGIADRIVLELSKAKLKPANVEGYETGEWVVLDFLDFIVHIFFEPTRQVYDFDKLWNKAKVVALPDELEEDVRKLRTGSIY